MIKRYDIIKEMYYADHIDESLYGDWVKWKDVINFLNRNGINIENLN